MEKIGKQNGVGIVFDFVVNHTSDKHKWFIESESSKTNPYHDWYIWKDPKGKNQPPNNWTSTFGGSAWQWNPKLNQFYYHYFYPQQPDLNWRNPKVASAMYGSTTFWYKRGVVGFRLDAVDTLFEDPNLTDNPTLPGKNEYGDQNQERKYNDKLPEVHDVMKGLRKAADQYNAVLIGETWTSDVSELKDYYGTKHDELQMPMDLMFTELKPLSANVFRKHVGAVDASGEWPVYVMSNHDIKRAYSRFADGKHDDDIAKVMAGMYLTLRGTAIMYYGEEIGMANNMVGRIRRLRLCPGRLERGKRLDRTSQSDADRRTGQPLHVGGSHRRRARPSEPGQKHAHRRHLLRPQRNQAQTDLQRSLLRHPAPVCGRLGFRRPTRGHLRERPERGAVERLQPGRLGLGPGQRRRRGHRVCHGHLPGRGQCGAVGDLPGVAGRNGRR